MIVSLEKVYWKLSQQMDQVKGSMPPEVLSLIIFRHNRSDAVNMKKLKLITVAKRGLPLVLAIYFLPWITLFYIICGLLDVIRNSDRSPNTFARYFFGNGVLTWMLSPMNLLFDLLSFPYWNKGVYRLNELPLEYQQELNDLANAINEADLCKRANAQMKDHKRLMLFYKWYGVNSEMIDDVPAFCQTFKFIRTIGVSAFRGHESTSRHFGPLRLTYRVLLNFGPVPQGASYIEVGRHTNYWRGCRLFIFDDTLIHQSFNQADSIRYCLFVDILRPSPWPNLMDCILRFIRFCLSNYNSVFYRNWDVVWNQAAKEVSEHSKLDDDI